MRQLRNRAAQRIDALAVRPHRERAVLEQPDRAGRANGPVHLIFAAVARLNDARARGHFAEIVAHRHPLTWLGSEPVNSSAGSGKVGRSSHCETVESARAAAIAWYS